MTTRTLEEAIALARQRTITPEEWEKQRRSFAFGNANIENPLVTRELVDEVADATKTVVRSA